MGTLIYPVLDPKLTHTKKTLEGIYMRAIVSGLCSTAMLLGFMSLPVQADNNDSPRFSDYPVAEVYQGAPVEARLSTEDDQMFRTRLNEASTMPLDFAGEYAITTWGCGTGCLMGAAASHKTGKIHWLPGESLGQYGKTDWTNAEPLTHQLDSSLIEIYALRGDATEDDDGLVHFYTLDNDKGFVYIKSLPKAE